MSRFIKDKDGDHIEVGAEDDGVTEGVTLTVTQQDGETTTRHAIIGPIDPKALIAAIRAEMGWDVDPEMSPTVEAVAEQINGGETTLSFEEAIGRRSNPEESDAAESAEEEPTAAEAHQHLAEHWGRRMDVVQRALTMLPAPRRQGGLAAAFVGEEIEDPLRVENALKIARFAADEDRDIPGVDR